MEQAGRRPLGPLETNVVSICGVLFERSRQELESDFVRWISSTGSLVLEPEECRILLREFFDAYSEQAAYPRATELEPGFLYSALRAVEATHPDRASDLVRVVSAYLWFLFDTGRWSGDQLGHAAALAALSPGVFQLHEGLHGDPATLEIQFPNESAADVDAALLDSAFARQFGALARFLAPGRQVTETFFLRLRDVPEAAACLGVRARLTGRSITLPATERFPERKVGSMGSIDELVRVWELFRDFPLLSERRASVSCNADGRLLASGPPGERAPLLRRIATAYYRRSISGEHLPTLSDMISPFLLEVLLAAASAKPPRALDVWNGEFSLPGVPSIPSAFLAQLLHHELQQIQSDGLVDMGEFITVPGYLRQCLSDALEGLISTQDAPWETPGAAELYLIAPPAEPTY